MINLLPRSNIANKVRNTKLPRTKPLMPLFEVLSNSIHAINEAKKLGVLSGNGKIKIRIIRQGDPETLKDVENVDQYPIISFEVIDNGIGLNDDNMNCFIESDTDHKIDIGGKGVGRFVCLVAFRELQIKSCYANDDKKILREFVYKATKEGIHGFNETEANGRKSIGTSITLSEYKEDYKKNVPLELFEIAREIIIHFQLYFIQNNAPSIIVENQNKIEVDVNNLFLKEFKEDVKRKAFKVGEFDFILYLTKSYYSKSHKLHFCAHNRTVREEGLYNRIIDLGKQSVKIEDENFYYQAFVVGEVLDENVDLERVGFNFPNDNDEDGDSEILTLANIRNEAINSIETLLFDYLSKIREEKIESYRPTIYNELPQYRNTIEVKAEEVRKLPPNLPKQKLDIELYRIDSNWRIEVKEEGEKLLEDKKDISNLAEYKVRYEKFLTEFNEIGKSDLARYIVHRKAVIELLDELLGLNKDEKFTNEDVIHSIFFPIRSSSDEIPHNKQNLWLLDERLTYHSFLSSDKTFEKIKELDSTSEQRADLLIFQDAIAFTEDKTPPYNSFTIVEFKKPQRNNYKDNDPTKNPLDQVEKYITDLLDGKITNRQGRTIKVDHHTPFYVYIVCDIEESFEKILKNREFNRTPDGQGYYTFKNKYYSAYIEVLPFEKVLADAKKRNRILFDKLGISQVYD